MTCPTHLADDPTGLACTLPAGHPHGHVFVSTSGVHGAQKEE